MFDWHLSEYDIADQLFPPPHRGVVLQLCVSHQDDIAGEVEISEDHDSIAVEKVSAVLTCQEFQEVDRIQRAHASLCDPFPSLQCVVIKSDL